MFFLHMIILFVMSPLMMQGAQTMGIRDVVKGDSLNDLRLALQRLPANMQQAGSPADEIAKYKQFLADVYHLYEKQNEVQALYSDFFRENDEIIVPLIPLQEEMGKYAEEFNITLEVAEKEAKRLLVLSEEDLAAHLKNATTPENFSFWTKFLGKDSPYRWVYEWAFKHVGGDRTKKAGVDLVGARAALELLNLMDQESLGMFNKLDEFRRYELSIKSYLFENDPKSTLNKLIQFPHLAPSLNKLKEQAKELKISESAPTLMTQILDYVFIYTKFFTDVQAGLDTADSKNIELYSRDAQNITSLYSRKKAQEFQKKLKDFLQKEGIIPQPGLSKSAKKNARRKNRAKNALKIKGSSSSKPELEAPEESEDSEPEEELFAQNPAVVGLVTQQSAPVAQKKVVVAPAAYQDFNNFKNSQQSNRQKFQEIWGHDLAQVIEKWTSRLSALGTSDVAIVTDPALKRKITLYFVESLTGQHQRDISEFYKIAPRVKKYLLDYQHASAREDSRAHTLDPFTIDLVRRKGVPVTYIDRRTQKQVAYQALLASVTDTSSGRPIKMDGIIQASWDKNDELYHLLFKRLRPEDFSGFYQLLTNKEGTVPEVFEI